MTMRQINGRSHPNSGEAALGPRREKSFSFRPQVFAGSLFMGMLVVGGGSWATLSHLEGAVVAQGMLKVDDNLKEIQHRDGGIVTEIAVKHGDSVEQGQLLVRLDDVQIRTELQIVRAQICELVARQSRLLAERDNLDKVEFLSEFSACAETAEHVRKGEERLFTGNKMARDSQKQQMLFAIEQTNEELAGTKGRLDAKMEETGIIKKELRTVTGLFEKGLIANPRVHTATLDRARLDGEKAEIEAAIARLNIRISDTRLQILAIDQNARTEAQRELRLVEAKLTELQERQVAIKDRLSRIDIRAPISGRINEMAIYTVGGVITPAEKIMTIVPKNADLRVEVKLAPTDIDQVHLKQVARMRFSSFNRNTTPEIAGEVVHISPSVTRDPATGMTHYVGEIAFKAQDVQLGEQQLMPGMPVEVFISTDQRTPLSYLVKPLSDQFNRAFREQ
jgi:HlyD family type I secretion membrane fusion protein